MSVHDEGPRLLAAGNELVVSGMRLLRIVPNSLVLMGIAPCPREGRADRRSVLEVALRVRIVRELDVELLVAG